RADAPTPAPEAAPPAPAPEPAFEPRVALAGAPTCEVEEATEVFRADGDEARGVRLALDAAGGMLAVVHGRRLSLVPLAADGAPGRVVDAGPAPSSLVRVVAVDAPRAFGLLVRSREGHELRAIAPDGAALGRPVVHDYVPEGAELDLRRVADELLVVQVSFTAGVELWRHGVEAGGLAEKQHRYATVRSWDTIVGHRVVTRGEEAVLIGAGRSECCGADPFALFTTGERGHVRAGEGNEDWVMRSAALDGEGHLVVLEQHGERWRRRSFLGEVLGPVDPAALPAPFDDELRARLEARDGRYWLSRRVATGEALAPDVDLGPAERPIRAAARGDLAWTGDGFAFARADRAAVWLSRVSCRE
ncbi:MAG: hypothetical protein KC619_00555, partial [Myxococcales bacterium]|nr:hypothetical protein [Myxococcales bacterium]